MTGGYALSYREAAQMPECAGNKGSSIGRLAAAGFRVPGGFVLSGEAYREFVHHAGIEAQIRALARAHTDLYTDEALFALDRIRLECLRAVMPESVRSVLFGAVAQAGLLGCPLVVRSSALGEDSPGASFAGMHRTLLNVLGTEALEAAIQACWASLWCAHAVLYRRRAGIPDRDALMAVVIQRLVPAEASGVAFTRNPHTGADEVILNATWGLGEALVSGHVEPDTLVVRPADDQMVLVRTILGEKARIVRLAVAGGVVWQDSPPFQRRSPALSAEQAIAIAETARRIESVFGHPLDIEWSRTGDDLVLLQARPITAAGGVEWASGRAGEWANGRPGDGATGRSGGGASGRVGGWASGTVGQLETGRPGERERAAPAEGEAGGRARGAAGEMPWGEDLWSTANFAEVLPPVPTPLTWSLARPLVEHGVRQVFGRAACALPEGLRVARLYRGRPYFNLGALQWLYWDCFGSPPAETNRALGGGQPEVAVPPGSPFAGRQGLARRWRRIRLFRLSLAALLGASSRQRSLERRLRRLEETDLALQSDLDLLQMVFDSADAAFGSFPGFLLVTIGATGPLLLLTGMLERRCGIQAMPLSTALLAGAGDMASAEQGYLLQRVARVAAEEPQARTFFERVTSSPVEPGEGGPPRPADWRAGLAGTRAGVLFEEFLRRYGHRAVLETETMQPRWSEDPTYLLETVAGFLAEGFPPLPDARSRARQARLQAERCLPFWERLPLRMLATMARLGGRQRENAKSLLVRDLALTRRIALEVGKRMIRRGVLDRRDDVFLLTAGEIRFFLLGESIARDPRSLVADRRHQLSAEGAAEHPGFFRGEEPAPGTSGAEEGTRPRDPVDPRSAGATGDGARFAGLAISAGIAEGRACVLRHPSEGGRLRAGDILVAPATDPAWSPLFLRAAAIVMETGGLLSHGAIVAREYGLPAVANVAGITHLVPDGARLRVDGDTGRVEVLAESATPPGPGDAGSGTA